MTNRYLHELIRNSLSESQLKLLALVAAQAAAQERPLYTVGGSVRDLLLGRRLNDFDLIVEGDAIALARSLAAGNGGRVTAHQKFGTAKWFLPDSLKTDHNTLDLISARSETYKHPAALPTVKPGTITDDLRRRDFTINALAIRLDGVSFGELRDDLDGMNDLQKGLIRVLHPHSFVDDPTRMYRAARYEGRYGFKMVDETLALIPDARPLVEKLSAQRIRHELDLILEEANASAILERLDGLGLLAVIQPALAEFNRSRLAELRSADPFLQGRQARWILWLMHLKEKELEALNQRLQFPADLLKDVRSAVALRPKLATLTKLKPSQVVELLENHSVQALEVLAHSTQDAEINGILTRYLLAWRHVKPKTTGHDLKKRNIPPGPRYAEILRRLRSAWLDGKINNEEEEQTLLNKLIKGT